MGKRIILMPIIFLLFLFCVKSFGQEKQFTSESLSFVIPEGWVDTKAGYILDNHAIFITELENQKNTDQKITIYTCNIKQDFLVNYNSDAWLRQYLGVAIVSAMTPPGNIMINSKKITTTNKLKANYELWRGQIVGSDKTSNYFYYIATIKPKKGNGKWVLFIGINPPVNDNVQKLIGTVEADNAYIQLFEDNLNKILNSIE